MKFNLPRIVLLLLVSMASLVACTSKYATNGELLYLKSQNGPNLSVPSPLTNSNLSHFYQLPLQSNPNAAVDIKPPTIGAH